MWTTDKVGNYEWVLWNSKLKYLIKANDHIHTFSGTSLNTLNWNKGTAYLLWQSYYEHVYHAPHTEKVLKVHTYFPLFTSDASRDYFMH